MPIAAGEHLYHLDAFRTLLQVRAVDFVILDLARVGGVTPWRKIAGLAQAHRVPVCGHVVPEIQVHLLAAVANGHMVEYVPRSAGILRAMPRIENGCIQRAQPPTTERLDQWLRARVQIPTRPDWVFVKVHTHGSQERNFKAILDGRLHEALQRLPYKLHYVTAREVYNLVKAAEAGQHGDPNRLRDFVLPPPPVRR